MFNFYLTYSIGTLISVVLYLIDQLKTWHTQLLDSYKIVAPLLTTIWYMNMMT